MTVVHATRAASLTVSVASGKRVFKSFECDTDYNHDMLKANDKLVPKANP